MQFNAGIRDELSFTNGYFARVWAQIVVAGTYMSSNYSDQLNNLR
jgi:hypothetical protein